MAQARSSSSAVLFAAAGWVCPGAGHLLAGHRARGLTLMVAILGLYVLGILIGGVSVVDAPASFGRVMDKPWFIPQALMGPVSFATSAAGRYAEKQYPNVRSFARTAEIGTLYCAIAGVLNLMAIVDAATRRNPQPRPGHPTP